MDSRSLTQKIVFMLFVCMVAACIVASADSIQLRNGRHLQGKFLGGSTTMIGFMTAQSVEYFQTSDVVALMFDNNSSPASNGRQPNRMDGNPTQPSCSPAAHRTIPNRRRNGKPEIKTGL